MAMSTSDTATQDTTDDPHAEGHGAHVVDPLWLYLGIFGALIFMTVVTVGASFVDFGAANTPIAVLIATVKASLVAVFFMHLRHDKPFHALVFVSGLVFLSFLFIFTLSDEGTRSDVDPMHDSLIEAPVTEPPAAAAASAGGGEHASAPAHHLAFDPRASAPDGLPPRFPARFAFVAPFGDA
jgi:cytochrome c oxidase subunit IV